MGWLALLTKDKSCAAAIQKQFALLKQPSAPFDHIQPAESPVWMETPATECSSTHCQHSTSSTVCPQLQGWTDVAAQLSRSFCAENHGLSAHHHHVLPNPSLGSSLGPSSLTTC